MQWDFIGVRYDNISFDVSGQETSPAVVFFKPDGTKMYVAGGANATIYQYSLSTPWDISTASYDGKNFVLTGEDLYPTGIFFKSDGTKMYMVGRYHDSVYQYSLSTPWDISTASYDNISFDVSGQETMPRSITFKPDGTKMWVGGSDSDRIYQYSLSTSWDISTASYDNISFDVSSQDIEPMDTFFKPNGTKMYVMGQSSKRVYQYSLFIPTPTAYAYTYIGG